MSDHIYRIPATNLHRLTQELDTLNKRAKRLKLAPVSYEIVGRGVRTVASRFGEIERTWIHVTVAGGAAQLNGWHFVATVTPTDNGAIIGCLPGEDVPRTTWPAAPTRPAITATPSASARPPTSSATMTGGLPASARTAWVTSWATLTPRRSSPRWPV